MKKTAQYILKHLRNKDGNISLTTVIVISSILFLSGAALIVTALSLISSSKAKSNIYAAEAHARSCLEESLKRLKDNNSFTGNISLNFPDSSSCSATVANQTDTNIKNIEITASSSDFTFKTLKTVNVLGLADGYTEELAQLTDVLGATTEPSSVTWQQPVSVTDYTDDKNAAYNLAYNSENVSKGTCFSDCKTLLNHSGGGNGRASVEYKITSTGMSSLYVSTTVLNIGDSNSRTATIEYSKDNGASFTTLATTLFGATGNSGTNINGTITFPNTIGGTVIVRLIINGSNQVNVYNIGWTNITFTPTATSFDFVPRLGKINLDSTDSLPTLPVLSTSVNADPQSVDVQGNYAYVVSTTANTMQIFDITRSNNVSVKSSTSVGTAPWSIKVQGRYAYIVSSTNNTMEVYDVSNPVSPSLKATVSTGTLPRRVIIEGNMAYVISSSDGGIKIYDITDPLSPKNISTLSTGSTSQRALFVKGKYLYTVSSSQPGPTAGQVRIYDVSIPTSPSLMSTLTLATTGYTNITVQGRYAFVSNNSAYINVIDIANPASPSVVNSNSGVYANEQEGTMFTLGNYLYTAVTSGFDVINIKDPVNPQRIGNIPAGTNRGLSVQGNTIYAIDLDQDKLYSYDMNGVYIQQLEAGAVKAESIHISNTLIGNDASFTGGVNIAQSLNVSGTAAINGNLDVVGKFPVSATGTLSFTASSRPFVEAIQDNFLYVGSFNDGNLRIVDISNPASPVLVSTLNIPSGVYSINVLGKYAYIVGASSNLTSVDISNPASPSIVSTLAVGGLTYPNPKISGRYLYLHNGSGFRAVDISSPSAMSIATSSALSMPASVLDMYIQGRYAYTTLSNNTFAVVDISNVSAPSLAASGLATGTLPSSVYVQGRYAYVGNYTTNTLQIIDIKTPTSLSTVTSISTAAAPSSVVVSGDYAYLVNNTGNTFQIINVNPASYKAVGTVATGTNPVRVIVKGKNAYVLNQNGDSLSIYDLGGAYVQNMNAGTINANSLTLSNNFSALEGDIKGGLSIGQTLNVNSSAAINGGLKITGSIAQSGADFGFVDGGIADSTAVRMFSFGGSLYFQNGSGNSINFRSKNGTTHSNFDDSGNLCVGCTSTTFKLDVGGRMRIRNGGGTAGLWLGNSTNSSDRAFVGLLNDSFFGLYANGGYNNYGFLMDVTTGYTYNRTRGYFGSADAIYIDNTEVRSANNNHRILFNNTNLYVESSSTNITYLNWTQGSGGVNVGNGASNYGTIRAAVFAISSSARYKDNISAMKYNLFDLLKLEPKEYIYKNDKEKKLQVGFIAEDVDLIYPQAVSYDAQGRPDAVDYSKFSPLIVQAIKDQQKQIDKLSKSLSPSNSSLVYWDLSEDTLNTEYNLATTKGISAESLNVKDAITALRLEAKCTSNSDIDPKVSANACGAIAQKYLASELTEAGDIVEIDLDNLNTVKKAKDKSKFMIGIVSPFAGVTLGGDGKVVTGGDHTTEIDDKNTLVAFSGKTAVKVNLENGDIKVGDGITASSKPGIGMKANSGDHVVGIALENYDSKSDGDKIIILISKSNN